MTLTDAKAAEFETHRGLLTGVAYRMLGSVSDAEDMVQETWLKWSDADGVETPRSWLTTVVTRLCLDRLKSARVQREQYYGTWLPEPFEPRPPAGRSPAESIDESVSIALLLVLEKLSPTERAGFLLHEVFGYSFDEVSAILEKTSAACRKLVSRARQKVRDEKPRLPATNREHEELMTRFLQACRAGDIEPLIDLFGDSTSFYSDGGGKATAVPKVLTDRSVIARFFIKVVQSLESQPGYRLTPIHFNGAPGVLFALDGQIVSALSLEIRDGRIAAIFGHRNPDKLREFDRRT